MTIDVHQLYQLHEDNLYEADLLDQLSNDYYDEFEENDSEDELYPGYRQYLRSRINYYEDINNLDPDYEYNIWMEYIENFSEQTQDIQDLL